MKRSIFLIAAGIVLTLCLTSATSDKKKLKKQIGSFVLIPTEMADSTQKAQLPEQYYVFEKEVTNLDYREFLYYLKANRPEEYELARIDTTVWNRTDMKYPEVFVEKYHTHPAYEEYPILNISKEAAKLYCTWLGEMLKETYLKDVDFDYEIRLPTKAEWQYAASGGFSLMPYAWGGPYLHDKKGKARCAFNNLSAQNIYTNHETGALEVNKKNPLGWGGIIAQPMKTGWYQENGFGLFDMCGNVAEMCSDDDVALGGHWNSAGGDVQIKSEMPNDGTPNSFVGFRPVLVIK